MGYQEESARKSEEIFLSVVVKAAIEKGDLRVGADAPGDLGWQTALAEVVNGTAKVWREYVATGTNLDLQAVRSSISFATDLEELKSLGARVGDIPQTKEQRQTTLEIYKNQELAIKNRHEQQ